MKKEAMFYIKKEDNKETNILECQLCHQNCIIKPGKLGLCGVRKNIDGILYAMTYGKFASIANDPIEKKPLYHFYPNKQILSLGSIGCNLKCFFCQNYEISQTHYTDDFYGKFISPEEIFNVCSKNNFNMVAFTYNEPLIMYEYLFDALPYLKSKNIQTVLVSNGSIAEEAALKIVPYISAANIDLKSFNAEFYTKHCKGNIDYVKKFIKLLYNNNVHIEITNLIITELNDDFDEIKSMIDWVADLSDNIPFHFSRYYPRYKSKYETTDVNFMVKAYSYAVKKLKYVYLGNVGINKYSSTYCYECGKELINRSFYTTFNIIKTDALCDDCNSKIPGVF